MKSSILILALFLVACTKEDKSVMSPFEGQWKMSGYGSIDTGLVVYITQEGLFKYYARYNHFGGIVEGGVDNKGVVDGSLKSGGFTVGSMSGTLEQDTGWGQYHTMGQSVTWFATRETNVNIE